MIWALLTWWFLNGSSAASGAILTSASITALQERVAAAVDDPARVKTTKRLLKGLRSDVKHFENLFAKTGIQLNNLYIHHEGNRDDALAVIEELNVEWTTIQERALDARFALRDSLTEEEWKAIFGDGQ